jgi:hypothetical protein
VVRLIILRADELQSSYILIRSNAFTAFTHRHHTFLNTSLSPGINPKGAAMGRPDISNMDECAVNCDAVSFNA